MGHRVLTLLLEKSGEVTEEKLRKIINNCCPKSRLVWHEGLQCHNCNSVLFGTRFNCDQMAFQVSSFTLYYL